MLVFAYHFGAGLFLAGLNDPWCVPLFLWGSAV